MQVDTNFKGKAPKTKKQIIEMGKRLWQKDFVAANDGNISVKLKDNAIYATATGISKGFMNSEMILQLDLDGNLLDPNPKYKPTSEIKMHLEVYKSRPDVKAIVHAHPPFSTAFAVAGIPLDKNILPESIISLGEVPIADYGAPSTNRVVDSILPLIKDKDALLLANHGALTLGENLQSAYFRMETLEHTAKILHKAQLLGNINTLTSSQIKEIKDLYKK